MTSLLGGGNIVHIANQLSSMANKREGENGFDTSASPSYEQTASVGDEKAMSSSPTRSLTLDLFKDNGLFACLQNAEIANSDTASSESPEPSSTTDADDGGVDKDETSKLFEAIQEMQRRQHIALMNSLGQPMKSDHHHQQQQQKAMKHEENEHREETPETQSSAPEPTMRDLMPVLAASNAASNSASPSAWARNAGRKKSHPVWEFFRDLKDTNGVGGVMCLHCAWNGDDRSPNNLRTHLKKFHTDDGIFAKFSLKLAQQQPTIVKVEEPDEFDMSLTTPKTEADDDNSCSGELDASQIMALLEKSMPETFSARKPRQREISPLTPAKANEILMAAGIRPHKKTSEIWEHYKCLSEKQNVECMYCWKVLKRNDSSTKSMWGHMNAYHQDILRDGVTKKRIKRAAVAAAAQIGDEKNDETPTQPYVKRVRAGAGNTPSMPSMMMMDQKMPQMLDSMTFALHQLQQSGNLNDFNTSLNFLDSLPKSSEIINIGNGFAKEESMMDEHENHADGGGATATAAASSSSSSDEPTRNAESPERGAPHSPNANQNGATEATSGAAAAGDSMSTNNQLAALVNLASSNPMMLAMLNAANSSSTPRETASASPQPPLTSKDMAGCLDKNDPSSFSLSEGHCAAVLMSMALDLDMTMSYHRRRVDIELCFESNRTAEKSGGRGKVICLTDLGKEIKIVERVNGAVTDSELWTKTDFNQFHWAIRGKCQKCFNKA
ncbi:unnamed protein product [Caenorhabditis bovis]|uniref:BED-type domain-containing protein n=1 Tax=Caenorhabditis bovis TaxID=2654633 RepID=A0A8S1EUZ8_9PELO|nr:unnamed protein product [Caenorhabditis bovis]